MEDPDARTPSDESRQGPKERVVDEAKSTYEDVKRETVKQAQETKEHVRRTAEESLDSGASKIAAQVGSVSKAFHRGSEAFREDGHDGLASQTERLADRIDDVRSFLDEKGAQGAYEEVRRLGRERPVMLIGGALAVGAAAAALLSGRRGGGMRR